MNFVPVVPFHSWTRRECGKIVAARLYATLEGSLRQLLKNEGYSPSVLETETPASVVATLFPLNQGTNKQQAVAQRAGKLVAGIQHAGACRRQPLLDTDAFRQLCDADPSIPRKLFEDLHRHQLSGYYFLPTVDPDQEHSGFVVLLRQIYHIPTALAVMVAGGASAAELGTDSEAPRARIDLRNHAYAMPVGQVVSPYLEHLMQSFANLYARIGVPDIPPSYSAELVDRLATEG